MSQIFAIFAKYLPIFAYISDSISIQTAELIIKCFTILEMGNHTFLDLVSDFGKGTKREFSTNKFWIYFLVGGFSHICLNCI